MNKQTLLLVLIIAIATILRLWQLGNVPLSPDWDEVALGYNAYSIVQTGHDEYGKFMPVVLRSYDDYKPALYMYTIIPAELLFGVNVFSVRLPSAIFGILTILAVYLLVKHLFKREDISLLTSLLLAISPWHIQFSRIGFESNVGLSLNVFAALLFLKGLKKPWLLSLSTIFAALAIYTYQSEKVFTPLFILMLIIIYRKELFTISKRYLITAMIVGFIVVLPMVVYILTDKAALQRVTGTSIFSSPTVYLRDNAQRLIKDHAVHDYIGLFLDNRRFIFARETIGGYLSHYNINFLLNGDISRHHAPGMGLVYVIEIPFILVGIYLLLFGEFDKKTKLLIFSWFLLAPVPASITTGVPHAVRTLNFLPTWQIFTAIGLLLIYRQVVPIKYKLLHIRLKYIILFFFFFIFMFNFIYYLDQYFIQQNYYYAKDWQYGYSQVVPIVEQMKGSYKQVVISEIGQMDKSYMFFLFYLKYPPESYQIIGERNYGRFSVDHHFDHYSFRSIEWSKDKEKKNVLYVGTPDQFSKGLQKAKYIYYPDGTQAVEIVGT